MTFCTDNGKSACSFHFRRKLDVGTTSRHVRRYCHGSKQTFLSMCGAVRVGYSHSARCALTGFRNDVGFLLVQLRVKHIVRNVAHLEHLAQQLGDFH